MKRGSKVCTMDETVVEVNVTTGRNSNTPATTQHYFNKRDDSTAVNKMTTK